MDGVEGTVKNKIFQHLKQKKCVINGAKDFAECANEIINGISYLYLAENEIMAEPQDIETSPKIPRTLKVHKVLRTCNEDNVCTMEFYELAEKNRPVSHSMVPRYKEGDPEVCGHNQLPLSYESDQTCGYYKEKYKGNEEWFECNLCDQWFHETCLKSNQHLPRSFSLFCSSFHVYIKVFYYLQFNGNWLPLFFLKIIY